MVFNSFFVVTKNVRLEDKIYLLGNLDSHANPGWHGNLDLCLHFKFFPVPVEGGGSSKIIFSPNSK